MEATSRAPFRFDPHAAALQPAAALVPSAAGGAGQAAPCDIRPDDSQQSHTS